MRCPTISTWLKIAVALVVCGLVPLSLVFAVGPAKLHFGLQLWPDASGVLANWTPRGQIETNGPFFQPLGSNGRTCMTCHQPRDAWSITPRDIRTLFTATNGLDPLFHTVDGATSPRADVSTVVARLRAYALLLDKGLIRVGRPLPAHAEFTLVSVRDPYGYASARQLSLFRRPLPTTNLPFLSTEMWDGRETILPIDGAGKGLRADLGHLVHDVALGPEQGTHAPTAQRVQQIVSFELGLFTTQVSDTVAGDVSSTALYVFSQPIVFTTSVSSAAVGQSITVTGTNFQVGETVQVYWDVTGITPLATGAADGTGAFVASVTIPAGSSARIRSWRSARPAAST